ncbi:lactate dehydrogenase [Clostridium botulinum]|uniref:lactate dehydrogenase n=1 Tax=Clostridium botulinum TaxID=1491 RepID=UPI001A933B04|nr:lactate dehydrogenase [Clostridium botulinum]MBO0523377.1 lactate dehydrogenase [Clostridium botulinum]MBO0529954.1 lactate dehydrogenase [Clostridium botulinum]MBO0533222.1 lactate dehydrogenase [Clostridium botulinum]MBO0536898.1 lactate dehydrogenase [Clostridium botulinum]MBO0538573.1 lactate dehydrogenase [Clostridium botulinum]
MNNLNLFYYIIEDYIIISTEKENLKEVTEKEASFHNGLMYFLVNIDQKNSRRSFLITNTSMLFIKNENLNILIERDSPIKVPQFIKKAIKEKRLVAINKAYENWKETLKFNPCPNRKWKINIVGLGDVGGTLITGLRLLGEDCIDEIGIYDKDINKINRWEYECNQIQSPNLNPNLPKIKVLNEDEIFNCNMFVFCVSVGVPKIGNEIKDVRLVQFEGNSKIVSFYAKLAKEKKFKGIFAIVSDPVDFLCKSALEKGLAPEQVRGYGLGVMNARAAYYAGKDPKLKNYSIEGRAFGPHGEGLVIANSIDNYDENLSGILTKKTREANLEIRSFGFKPYIAPALSSGSFSLIATIKSEWHYSATFLNGAFMGIRNKFINNTIELETYKNMPSNLLKKLEETHAYLKNF